MDNRFYDAIIIGGGASGMMCAISAKTKNSNIKIAIIEKNDRVGKKLLSTGNGRCNLTNVDVSKDKYAGTFAEKAEKILNKYTTETIIEIFNKLGLETYYDNEGRYYPICKQASAVVDVMRFACERLEIDVFCGENIKSLKNNGDAFKITTDNKIFVSDKLVIACGSKASPKLGATAAAADYFKNFGIKFTAFSPVLCPIKVKSEIIKSLKGIRVSALTSLNDENGKTIKSEKGEVQFTENSLSGICIFNLSPFTKKGCEINIDILSDFSEKEIYSIIQQHKYLFFDLPVDCLLTGILQKRVTQAILKVSGIKDFSRYCSSLQENEIQNICKTLKQMKFEVIENSGFDNAQASSGGVVASEINSDTMEIKKIKGLYVCGEAVDICGMCGGYNLHFAFASGYLVGENL